RWRGRALRGDSKLQSRFPRRCGPLRPNRQSRQSSSRVRKAKFRAASSFVDDALAARANHRADPMPWLLQLVENARGFRKVALGDHENHSDTEVEGAPPVVFGDVANLAEQLED